jgi:hypothetical protein
MCIAQRLIALQLHPLHTPIHTISFWMRLPHHLALWTFCRLLALVSLERGSKQCEIRPRPAQNGLWTWGLQENCTIGKVSLSSRQSVPCTQTDSPSLMHQQIIITQCSLFFFPLSSLHSHIFTLSHSFSHTLSITPHTFTPFSPRFLIALSFLPYRLNTSPPPNRSLPWSNPTCNNCTHTHPRSLSTASGP